MQSAAPRRSEVTSHILDKSPFGERHRSAVPDDDVIEQADVDQGERFLDALGNQFVSLTRFGDAGGMIVRIL